MKKNIELAQSPLKSPKEQLIFSGDRPLENFEPRINLSPDIDTKNKVEEEDAKLELEIDNKDINLKTNEPLDPNSKGTLPTQTVVEEKEIDDELIDLERELDKPRTSKWFYM